MEPISGFHCGYQKGWRESAVRRPSWVLTNESWERNGNGIPGGVHERHNDPGDNVAPGRAGGGWPHLDERWCSP